MNRAYGNALYLPFCTILTIATRLNNATWGKEWRMKYEKMFTRRHVSPKRNASASFSEGEKNILNSLITLKLNDWLDFEWSGKPARGIAAESPQRSEDL